MKHFIAVMIFTLLGSYAIFGQCTFGGGNDKYCIGNISIIYKENKFIISGFEVNPDFHLQNHDAEPAIAIFIETGDGNYISEKFFPDANNDIDIYYKYPAQDVEYKFRPEAAKHYDGGGPRRMILPLQSAIQTKEVPGDENPHILDPVEKLTVYTFPNDIVEDDTVTIVIRTGKTQSENLFLHYDNRLVDHLTFEDNFRPSGLSHDDIYKKQKFSVSGYAGSDIKNTFIRLKPNAHFVAGIPMNENVPTIYITPDGKIEDALAKIDLKVLPSHDPNNMNLSFCDFCPSHSCPRFSRRETRNRPITFHYTVNFENSGMSDEDSVRVIYHCMIQHLKEDVTISNRVFGQTNDPSFANSQLTHLNIQSVNEGYRGREPIGTVKYLFTGRLKGISRLPYGDPATQGSITFTIDTKEKFKDLSPDDRITSWAEITFVSAKDTIKTNEINTSRRDFRRYYNRRCTCQKTFFLFRWICRLFNGI